MLGPPTLRLVPRPAGEGTDLLCTYLFRWPVQTAALRATVPSSGSGRPLTDAEADELDALPRV